MGHGFTSSINLWGIPKRGKINSREGRKGSKPPKEVRRTEVPGPQSKTDGGKVIVGGGRTTFLVYSTY